MAKFDFDDIERRAEEEDEGEKINKGVHKNVWRGGKSFPPSYIRNCYYS